MEENLKKKILNIIEQLQKAEFGNSEWFYLSNLGQNISLISGFQYLLSLEDLNVTLYPHQEEAVLQILQQMHGSALIADEVGLGKTIIAGTVLSELKIRGLINSVLILVPPSLTNQWYDEMVEKFNFEIPVVASGRGNWNQDQFITSINLLTHYPDRILNKKWDLVILDEAHRVRNRKSKTWKIINQINKKYILMLTATPMQNELEDIFSLTHLLKPGILGTYRDFRKQYAIPKNHRGCKDPLKLRQIINDIMIRRKRSDVTGIFFPERIARTISFDLNPLERKLYDSITNYVISSYTELNNYDTSIDFNQDNKLIKKYNISSSKFLKRKIWLHKFTLMLLQRRICSSPTAAKETILKMIQSRKLKDFDQKSIPLLEELCSMTDEILLQNTTKINRLLSILDQLPGKCVIFTEFKDSLKYISKYLKENGFSFIEFSGSLSSSKRAEVIQKFQNEKEILLSTDAGSEGLNLQFANTIINFDLPWNPMRIEQRIGRVYRLMQLSTEVYIFNLSSNDSIEQYVLEVLHEKLGLFETILGDLSSILGSMIKTNADGRSSKLESEIMSFFIKHGHSEKLRSELEKMISPITEDIEVQDELSKNILDVDSIVEKY